MQLEVSRGSFSGAVLVSHKGTVVFSKAYGLGKLFLWTRQTPEVELVPVGEADFVLGDIELHMVVDDRGHVNELVATQGLQEGHARRMK